MKRIQSACLEKTLHFILKEELGHDAAAQTVRDEVKHYKAQLERSHTKYKILSEEVQADDSIIVRIKMQYNNSPIGNYLD